MNIETKQSHRSKVELDTNGTNNHSIPPLSAAEIRDKADNEKLRRILLELEQKEAIPYLSMAQRAKFMKIYRAMRAQQMRNSFSEFVRGAWDIVEPGTPLIWGWHMDAICKHLQAVTEGKITRLLINIPPGHSKSLLASVLWPVWNWLRRPEWRLLCASYSMELANRDSLKCRELILDPWFQNTFRPKWSLSRAQNSKSRFKNTRRGERMCLSVGSRTTGFRGDAVLVDDPLNVTDAMSETKRPKANAWLDQALSNRLNDLRTGTIVIIMQCLHHEDVSGHVLEQGGYVHLCLPSRFDPERISRTSIGWSDPRQEKNEPLFRAMFPNEVLDIEERRMGRLAFAGQHQQNPTPDQGNLFKANMFCKDQDGKEFWPFPTVGIRSAILSWDTAFKTSSYNDFTAGCLVMEGTDNFVYLYALMLERIEVPELEKRILVLWATWRKQVPALSGCKIEEGPGTMITQYLQRNVINRKQAAPPSPLWTKDEWELVQSTGPIQVMPYPPIGDKVQRAHQVLPMLANGRVRLVDTSLSKKWLDQLMAFPVGGHDDAVDATVAGIDRFQAHPNAAMSRELLESCYEKEPNKDFDYANAVESPALQAARVK